MCFDEPKMRHSKKEMILSFTFHERTCVSTSGSTQTDGSRRPDEKEKTGADFLKLPAHTHSPPTHWTQKVEKCFMRVIDGQVCRWRSNDEDPTSCHSIGLKKKNESNEKRRKKNNNHDSKLFEKQSATTEASCQV